MVRKQAISPIDELSKVEVNSLRIGSERSVSSNGMSTPTEPDLVVQASVSIKKNSQSKQNSVQSTKTFKLAVEKNEDTSKSKKILRKILMFFFSHFGMLFLVISYIFLGAVLFQTIEQNNEIQNCETAKSNVNQKISDYTVKLYNYINYNISIDPILDNSSVVGPSVYNPEIDSYIMEIRDTIIQNYQSFKYWGQLDCDSTSLWQLESAVLFTVTVVTTIGYGHIYPTTWQGQIVIICYAMIGIPFFLMTTAKISLMLAAIFSFVYESLILFPCKCMKINLKKKNNLVHPEQIGDFIEDPEENKDDQLVDDITEIKPVQVPLFPILSFFAGYLALGAFIMNQLENWDMITGIYFCFVTLSTIGFGDFVPGIPELQAGNRSAAVTNIAVSIVYIFIGISIVGMCFSLMNSAIVDKLSNITIQLKKSEKKTITTQINTETAK